MNIVIALTLEQTLNLSHALYNYQDEGPFGGGWASPVLAELRDIVDAAIKEKKGGLIETICT